MKELKQLENLVITGMYCRKSSETEDRQMHSLDSQEDELKKLANRIGMDIFVTFRESKSAKFPEKRPKFKELLTLIENGSINTILVWNPDRLSRNSVDAGKLLYLMDLGKLHEIITPTQRFMNTPNDKFLLNILWGHAKLDNDNKGQNVKRGLKKKLELGWYPFVAPIGYLNTPDREKGEKIIEIDHDRFKLVRKLWDLMLTGGYTVPEIRDIAEEKYNLRYMERKNSGGNYITRSALYEIFKNPFYYGWFQVNGEWFKGSHKPMVTKDEFDKVQQIISRTTLRRPKAHIFAYTGMFKCFECGCSITATRKVKKYPKTKRTASYEYYHCTKKRKIADCHQKPIKAEDLNEQILNSLQEIELHPDFVEWSLKFLYLYKEVETNLSDDVARNLKREQKRLKERLDNLLELKLDCLLTSEEFSEKKKELQEQELDVKGRLNNYEEQKDNWYTKSKQAIDFAFKAKTEYEKGDVFKKREILNAVGSNFYLNDGKLCYDLQKPFFLFKNLNLGIEPKIEWLEPVDYAFVTEKVGYSEPANPLWLPLLDSFLNLDIELKVTLQQLKNLIEPTTLREISIALT